MRWVVRMLSKLDPYKCFFQQGLVNVAAGSIAGIAHLWS